MSDFHFILVEVDLCQTVRQHSIAMAFKDEISLSFVSKEEALFEDGLDGCVWDPVPFVQDVPDPESPWTGPPERRRPFPHDWMDTVDGNGRRIAAKCSLVIFLANP